MKKEELNTILECFESENPSERIGALEQFREIVSTDINGFINETIEYLDGVIDQFRNFHSEPIRTLSHEILVPLVNVNDAIFN